MKPLVYVAGPMTKPDHLVNARRGILAGTALLASGLVVPFLPHLSVLWEMVQPLDYETWLQYDFDVIRHCQALLRLPGESAGADREVIHATEIGIPVFFEADELLIWAARRA